MKTLKALFHFLGGIYVAIFLITTAALTVIAGTFLESYTESHLYASSWTYSHPLFAVLLSFFFINILFSALRRWPFRSRHIPFLITHLGLLMIIAGTIIKNRVGVQGNLSIWEGSGGQNILIPNSYSLHVEKREGTKTEYPLASLEPWQTLQKEPLPELKLKIVGMTPHSNEKWETWVKGNQAIIAGIPPIPIVEWNTSSPLPEPLTVPISKENNWQVLAVRTDNIHDLIQHAYFEGLDLNFSMLKKSLSFSFKDSLIADPLLNIDIQGELFHIPLNGKKALYTIPQMAPLIPGSNIHIDLVRSLPLLILAEETGGDTFLVLFDQHGRVHGENFGQARMKSLVSYDNGFGGYAVQTSLPDPSKAISIKEKEKNNQQFLCEQLREAMARQPPLAPPLVLFKQACEKSHVDFIDHFVDFLVLWDQEPHILFSPSALPPPFEQIISKLDLDQIPPIDRKAMQWISLFFDRIEEPILAGEDLFDLLKRNRWPFVDKLNQENDQTNTLTRLAQQIYTLIQDLPSLEKDQNESVSQKTKLFSAYLKAFGIEYSTIRTYLDEKNEILTLETPLTVRYRKEASTKKYEDNQPSIIVEAQQGMQKELFALTYDASAIGFRWPILQGQYLIRLQPQSLKIPYRVRLRQARQINYPQTQQAYSYEGDIWIQENNKEAVEKTLSMNQVHETWDGYRFYLAGMSPPSDQNIRRAHIIVNHDPAKYFLTYPGASLVALGIVLLFWLWPYKKSG
jgi:hypothetical protein